MVWRFVRCVKQGLRAAAGDRVQERDELIELVEDILPLFCRPRLLPVGG